MELKPGDFDKYVDTVLKHFKAGESAPIFDGIDRVTDLTPEKTERLIFMSFLLEEGLLRIESEGEKNNPIVRITPKGYVIACLEGGWSRYIELKREEEKLKNDLVKSSIRTNKSSNLINNLQKRILKLTLTFSVIATIISLISLALSYSEFRLQKRLFELELDRQTLSQPEQLDTERIPGTTPLDSDSLEILETDSSNN